MHISKELSIQQLTTQGDPSCWDPAFWDSVRAAVAVYKDLRWNMEFYVDTAGAPARKQLAHWTKAYADYACF